MRVDSACPGQGFGSRGATNLAVAPLGKVVRWRNNIWKISRQLLERSEHFATERGGETLSIDLQQAFRYRGCAASKYLRSLWKSREKYALSHVKEECKTYVSW